MVETDYSTLLFQTVGFTSGLASIADLSGNSVWFNETSNPEAADQYALRSDVSAIARDMRSVIGGLEAKQDGATR